MKNRDIQFYFNRQERPVNSGRITQIRDGSYGSEITAAAERDLSDFLSAFVPSTVSAVAQEATIFAEPTIAEKAIALFARNRTGWVLRSHETDKVECKDTFCLKPEGRFADPLRSIAGLANNSGGFIFFGVAELPDGSLNVKGLPDETFAKTDPAEINRCLAGALHPVPIFSTFVIKLDNLKVGVIYVEKHKKPPLIAVKNVNSEIKEGAIYYRYVGETRVIKPGELQEIISYREQKAIADFSRRISRIAVGSAATLDLDTGKVEGKTGSFIIDEDLLPKIQFLRHGEFHEQKGAPALRLIGEVAASATSKRHTVRSNVTSEAVILNFLKAVSVVEPMQYILHSAHSGRAWLPLFYYVEATRLPVSDIVSILQQERATHVQKRDAAIRRLSGATNTAYQKPGGRAKDGVVATLKGELQSPLSLTDVAPVGLATQGLPSGTTLDYEWLKSVLLAAYELTNGNSDHQKAARSIVYRAACRLDELEFAAVVKTR